MRQRDVNQLATIWATEVRDADQCELAGLEVAIGSVIKPLTFGMDPRHPLDLSPLHTLVTVLKERQQGEPHPWRNMIG